MIVAIFIEQELTLYIDKVYRLECEEIVTR
jgi:hypothetical protein